MDKTINLDLVGLDGNAFALMGAFRKQARREGWDAKEIETVMTECQSSDYDHLLATLIKHCRSGE
jgi:hypothetical protein